VLADNQPIGNVASISVLVVDDHAQFVTVLEAILLGDRGVELVGSAENGEAALQLVAERGPDVVLMDISMPVLDGIEATRLIRRDHPESAVVMVTGSGSDEDRAAAREAGAVGYVQKERILEELSDAIRAAAAERGLS
jgi:DNA-binding NarL/FixJ family response regulator